MTTKYSPLTDAAEEIQSVLHCIYHTAPYRDAILSYKADPSQTAIIELQNVLKQMNSGNAVSLKSFRNAISKELHGTMSTAEFMGTLIGNVLDKPIPPKVMTGGTTSYVRCHTCGKENVRKEEFIYLNLSARNEKNETMQQCYDEFATPEELIGENQYQCAGCGYQKRDASKGMKVSAVADVLVVFLERVAYDFQTYRMIKKQHKVTFPMLTFDVNKMLDPNSNEKEDIYELYAVTIAKQNNSYMTYFKEWPKFEGDDNMKWFCNDNGSVTQMPKDIQTHLVMQAFGGLMSKSTAELLFYRRKSGIKKYYQEAPKAFGDLVIEHA